MHFLFLFLLYFICSQRKRTSYAIIKWNLRVLTEAWLLHTLSNIYMYSNYINYSSFFKMHNKKTISCNLKLNLVIHGHSRTPYTRGRMIGERDKQKDRSYTSCCKNKNPEKWEPGNFRTNVIENSMQRFVQLSVIPI